VKGKVRVKGKVKGKGRRRKGGNGENGAGVIAAKQRTKKKADFLTADHSDGRRWIFTGVGLVSQSAFIRVVSGKIILSALL